MFLAGPRLLVSASQALGTCPRVPNHQCGQRKVPLLCRDVVCGLSLPMNAVSIGLDQKSQAVLARVLSPPQGRPHERPHVQWGDRAFAAWLPPQALQLVGVQDASLGPVLTLLLPPCPLPLTLHRAEASCLPGKAAGQT